MKVSGTLGPKRTGGFGLGFGFVLGIYFAGMQFNSVISIINLLDVIKSGLAFLCAVN